MKLSLSSAAFLALSLVSSVRSSPTTHETRQATESCATNSVASFNLQARYKDDATTTTPVKIIAVNTVPHVGYSILSASASSSYNYNSLSGGGMRGEITGNPYLKAVSYTLFPGESPTFISTQYPPPAWSGYCFFPNLVPSTGPNNLGANGASDQWSLCKNSTAGGRLDVVYVAASGHPSYDVGECRGVWLEQV